jgi:hypothetical protein
MIGKLLLLVWLGVFTAAALGQSPAVCNVRMFGAKGDGVTLDTAAITAAIGACAKQGGGTVYVPPGRYVIGTVQLASHIHLLLDSGAALVGSHDVRNYLASPPFGFARDYGVNITGEGTLLGMLIAKNAEDISIDGDGEIDGEGDAFMGMEVSHGGNDYDAQRTRNPEKFQAAMTTVEYGPVEPDHRPGTLIVFFHCKNVRLHGITLRQAPNWTLNLLDVQGASISDLRILNDPRVPNNDGIDCMGCRDVEITNCHIDTGDDGFAIVNSERVNVSNCSISSRSAAIRLESTKLSTFTGLSMDTNRGIAVFANRYPPGEDLSTDNVIFSDITIRTHLIPGGWWGKAEPIYIAVQSCTPGEACPVRVRHVVFNDITAEAESGALLLGAVGSPITDVVLKGVHLHMIPPPSELSESVGGNLDLRWTSLTPSEGIFKSDIPAIYAKQVNGLTMRDVTVDWQQPMPEYFSSALRVQDFNDLTIDGFAGRQAQASGGAAIDLENGAGVSITGSRAMPGTQTFLHLDAVTDRRVFVNYDLSGAKEVVDPKDTRFDTDAATDTGAKRHSRWW